MKEIKLTRGKVALVDDEDYEIVSQYKWSAVKGASSTWYARAYKPQTKKKSYLMMHRLIMNIQDNALHIDHINHDGLNNCKNNLRIATARQNQRNSRSRLGSTSNYLGIYLQTVKYKNKTYNYWHSQIRGFNSEVIFLGTYKSEIEAARAYDEAAKKYHGEFANLNFKESVAA